MPALSFTVFKDKLLSGEKTQTIRKVRKRLIKVGDKLYIYWHMRQRDCEHLFNAVCTSVMFIQIQFEPSNDAVRIDHHWQDRTHLIVTMSDLVADDLAHRDGFKDRFELARWFYHKYGAHAVSGAVDAQMFQVIRWRKL